MDQNKETTNKSKLKRKLRSETKSETRSRTRSEIRSEVRPETRTRTRSVSHEQPSKKINNSTNNQSTLNQTSNSNDSSVNSTPIKTPTRYSLRSSGLPADEKLNLKKRSTSQPKTGSKKTMKMASDSFKKELNELDKALEFLNKSSLGGHKSGLEPKAKATILPKKPKIDIKSYFDSFIGIDEKIDQLKNFVNHFIVEKSFYPNSPKSLLLTGPTGVGKTTIVEALTNYLSDHLSITLLKIRLPDPNSYYGESTISDNLFKEILEVMKKNKSDSYIILFDDFHNMDYGYGCLFGRSSRIGGLENFLKTVQDYKEKKLFVIFTTSKNERLAPKQLNTFDAQLKLDLFSLQTRKAILNSITQKDLPGSELDIERLAKKTPGFMSGDYNRLFMVAKRNANKRFLDLSFKKTNNESQEDNSELTIGITNDDVEEALKIIVPLSKVEDFQDQNTDVDWEDIGGLDEVKELIELSILGPVEDKEVAKKLGLDKPLGILMYGPPGCGKTLLAKAIANRAELNFISVRGPELLNKYYGESERKVRELFERANKLSPCIIFFDEFDSLVSCKRENAHEATERVTRQLLTEMDGFKSRSCFMLAATNKPDQLDPAILRPGRFGDTVYIGVPNATERVKILKAITKNGTVPECSSSVDFEKIGSNPSLEGYTGADLKKLVEVAARSAYKRFHFKKKLGEQLDKSLYIVTQEDFENAIKTVKPSVNEMEKERFEKIRIEFERKLDHSENFITMYS